MSRCDCGSSPRVLVIASIPWCLVAARFFFEKAFGGVSIRTASADPQDFGPLIDGWADVAVVVTPTRQERHLTVLQAVHAEHPHLRLIAMSVECDVPLAERARSAGACGYLHFETSAEDAVRALRAVADGGTAFPPTADEPTNELPPIEALQVEPAEMEQRLARLTRRERQVMALLGRGYANREIAEALGLREGTIRIYVHRVIRQLGLRNRVDVALCARQVSSGL